ncbi:hypothetical protein Ahy_A06g028643 [Arachis hypogaea]|uniref:SWIM-type domain-containing protein n=1 Tax=Arachis hypogaea TaxID=3818 RepID=A0A445CRF7_ARAHY|nr:hypothetical protein Ahy_A06g028643 [Arachis hypogaea]
MSHHKKGVHRSQVIKSALIVDDSGWKLPNTFHVYYVMYMEVNFMSHFKSVEGKRYFMNASYSPSKVGSFGLYIHNDTMSALGRPQDMFSDTAIQLQPVLRVVHGFMKWAIPRRFGHRTTNHSECMNVALKGALFVMKSNEAQEQLASVADIEKNREKIPKMRITYCDRRASLILVEELEPLEGSIECGHMCLWSRQLQFLCRHALATCVAASVDWGSYVHPLYMQEAVFKVYEVELSLIPDEMLWPEWYGTRFCSNSAIRRKQSAYQFL